ncbi:MAG: recombinase RecA [Proteobacteria bacterium]|jgi:recombination protein RecA|nr:recombinase RecA [Pseudomonadota bacterium]
MKEEARKTALGTAIQSMEKRYGKGAVMRLGDRPKAECETVETGSLSLNAALGVGGYPRGRVIEVFGPESSGKTTLALHAIAEAQKVGGTAAFIDAEHALDITYAGRLGVDTDALIISQPDSGEQALEITEALVRSGAVDMVVIDSVAALVPQAEIEGQMGDAHMGLQARLMSQALRKLTGITSRTGTIVLFINQIRQKIGVVFGSGEVTTGGNALKFYSSIRIEIRRIGSITKNGEVVGNKTRLKVVKNKLAPPFKKVEVEIIYGRGICSAGELLDLAERAGLMQKSGSWYNMEGERLGQGRENLREMLLSDSALHQRIATALQGPVGPASAK